MILSRIVPYVCGLLDDPVSTVRARGIRSLVEVLKEVEVVGVGDFDVFEKVS